MSLRTIAVVGTLAFIIGVVFVKIIEPPPPNSVEAGVDRFEESKSCEIGQILASDGRAAIDPALEPLRQRLETPPFHAFSRFEFLASREFPCNLDHVVMPLHGGGVLTLSLHNQRADHREWFIEVRRDDGSTLMQTRAAVYEDRPLLIVTSNGDQKSVVIWVSAQA